MLHNEPHRLKVSPCPTETVMLPSMQMNSVQLQPLHQLLVIEPPSLLFLNSALTTALFNFMHGLPMHDALLKRMQGLLRNTIHLKYDPDWMQSIFISSHGLLQSSILTGGIVPIAAPCWQVIARQELDIEPNALPEASQIGNALWKSTPGLITASRCM